MEEYYKIKAQDLINSIIKIVTDKNNEVTKSTIRNLAILVLQEKLVTLNEVRFATHIKAASNEELMIEGIMEAIKKYF